MITKTTRRRVLTGMAGSAAVGVTGIPVPATANGADAEFFALYEEHRRANAEFEAALDALEVADMSGVGRSQALAAEARTCARDWELFQRLGEAPVYTLGGVRTKLQVLAKYLHDGVTDIEPPFVDTALEAIERIGGAS